MGERRDADELAERLLTEPNSDPDDELRMLSRQLLRRRETIDRMEKRLMELHDPHGDLVNANRDIIMSKYEEAFTRIRNCLKKTEGNRPVFEHVEVWFDQLKVIGKIIDAAMSFHPMHGESWSGWPKEDEG